MADTATTFDIGGGVSAGLSALQFVQNILNGARSATIQVENYTSLTLYYKGAKHDSGDFAVFPADKIEPGKANVFGSQNKGGSIMTGAIGYVYYAGSQTPLTSDYQLVPGDTGYLGGIYLTVVWDNPYYGSNKANAGLGGGYRSGFKVRYHAGAGNTLAPFIFRLYEANQIAGPQIQDLSPS